MRGSNKLSKQRWPVRLESLTAVLLKIQVIWDVTLSPIFQRTVMPSSSSLTAWQWRYRPCNPPVCCELLTPATQCHIPEDFNLQNWTCHLGVLGSWNKPTVWCSKITKITFWGTDLFPCPGKDGLSSWTHLGHLDKSVILWTNYISPFTSIYVCWQSYLGNAR